MWEDQYYTDNLQTCSTKDLHTVHTYSYNITYIILYVCVCMKVYTYVDSYMARSVKVWNICILTLSYLATVSFQYAC